MFRDSKRSIWRSADCWRMRFPHHPAQEVRVCSTEVWVILSLLQHSVEYLISALLGMRSICTGCPSLFVLPSYLLCICDLRRIFALSTAHSFILFVWLLSVCHQRAHTFPTAECVILAPTVLSPSRKHTVFLMAFTMSSDTFPRRLVWGHILVYLLFVYCEKSNFWWLPANNSACATRNSRALPHHMAAVM